MIEQELLDTPYIWVTDFEDHNVINFYNHFMSLEMSPSIDRITIYIHSFGGSIYGMLSMRDLIKRSTKEVVTVVIGKAKSAGACLAASGDVRFAAPQARYMIHQVSSGAEGTSSDLANRSDEIQLLNEQLLANLSEDTGKTKAFWKKRYYSNNTDFYFSSDEALELGMADHIAIPTVVSQQSTDIAIVQEVGVKPRKGKK